MSFFLKYGRNVIYLWDYLDIMTLIISSSLLVYFLCIVTMHVDLYS